MPILFLIPARGGSKGLPGKNLAPVGGIPLVGRVARLGKQCLNALGGAGRVICSTDDPAIAETAKEWGAEVPFVRPPGHATDTATSMDVVLHALAASNDGFDTVVLLQPTSPFTEVEDVLSALRLHEEHGVPVISVAEVSEPIEWQFRLAEDGFLEPLTGRGNPIRRQETEMLLRPNGAIYVAGATWLQEHRSFVWPRSVPIVMPPERSLDVDSASDLLAANCHASTKPLAPVLIGNRPIGQGHPCFIIAEAGVNHNGDVEMAKRLVDAAKAAGVDAVKFQTFKADRLAVAEAQKAEYQVRTTGEDESQLDMLRRLELSEEDHRAVLGYCRQKGITFLSSPFDEESADFLECLGLPAFKIPSGEITNLPFLAHVARKGRPMIVSTGMSTLGEVEAAVSIIKANGDPGIILLHCVSNYPADPKDVNLRAIKTMRTAFGVPVGYSDHTEGDEVALAAVALGACVLEKHFTLDRALPGPDHQASIEPAELSALVRRVRRVEASLGSGTKAPTASETTTALVARKSLVASCDIAPGTVVTAAMVRASRPGNGIPPSRLDEVLGRVAKERIPASTMIRWEMLS